MQDGQFTCRADPKFRPFSFSWDQFLFADRVQRLNHELRLENKFQNEQDKILGNLQLVQLKLQSIKDCVYFVDKYQFLYTPEPLSF